MHRWSGWPGAWCLDCGADNPIECCIMAGHGDNCTRPGCHPGPCMFPGRGLFDPYRKTPLSEEDIALKKSLIEKRRKEQDDRRTD